MAKILVLDDEACIATTTGQYLKRSGHSVSQCSSPESAIEHFKDANGAVDLLVADVTLGAISGVQVALELKARTPHLKLLFMSGYPFSGWSIWNAALFRESSPDSVRVLQKPFSVLDLLLRVDELVGQAQEAVLSSGAAGPD